MSQQEILKSIYQFLEILQSSGESDVCSWNSKALQNAFHWAHFCKKVHAQSVGKPYFDEFNEKITNLGLLPWRIGNVKIDLNLLGEGEYLLQQKLMQNTNLPTDLYALLLGNIFDSKDLQQDLQKWICIEARARLVDQLVNQVNHESLEPAVLEVLAEFWCQYVTKVQTLTGSRRERSEELLNEKLTSFVTTVSSLTVLLTLSVLPGHKENQEAQKYIISWIVDKSSNKSLLCQCELDVLRKVSAQYFIFYQFLIKVIISQVHQTVQSCVGPWKAQQLNKLHRLLIVLSTGETQPAIATKNLLQTLKTSDVTMAHFLRGDVDGFDITMS